MRVFVFAAFLAAFCLGRCLPGPAEAQFLRRGGQRLTIQGAGASFPFCSMPLGSAPMAARATA